MKKMGVPKQTKDISPTYAKAIMWLQMNTWINMAQVITMVSASYACKLTPFISCLMYGPNPKTSRFNDRRTKPELIFYSLEARRIAAKKIALRLVVDPTRAVDSLVVLIWKS